MLRQFSKNKFKGIMHKSHVKMQNLKCVIYPTNIHKKIKIF